MGLRDTGGSGVFIDASQSRTGASTRCLGDFRPLTVEEADLALVNGLIDVQDYTRCLVAVEPLIDTLLDASASVRKKATFELKKRGGRDAVKLLEQALEDNSEEVRLFAAEALEKLDSMYNEAIRGLIERIRSHPSRRSHVMLGKVYFDYAYKGMYDEGVRTIYFEKAVREFEKALAFNGEDESEEALIYLYLGSAFAETGLNDKALDAYEHVRDLRGEDRDLLVCEAAVHFACGRYATVRRICRRIVDEFGKGDFGEVLSLWTR